nr:PREDICTED: peptide chain release factor 1-like, mitochondrial isoform X2 [Bemisia tabaci]
MDDMVKEEMKEYEDQITLLKNQILEALIPVDEEDKLTDVILEVNAGVGGQEAMLFACELFDMYSAYILRKGWSCEVIDFSKSDLGGIRKGCVQVSGKDSCRLLRFEGGVHRVQRVPKTEKAGRIHTSTVSVAVLPQPKEADVVIAEKDLKIETKRSSGAGGQAVQTSDSAVRIVHLPTGIAVECQVERFQHKNKEIALQKLRALLYQRQQDETQSKISSSRKIQVGSRGRSEKIRTYNFNQDRVTDHRIGKNIHNLSSFLEGGDLLDEMIHLVYNKYKLEQLEAVFNSMTAG